MCPARTRCPVAAQGMMMAGWGGIVVFGRGGAQLDHHHDTAAASPLTVDIGSVYQPIVELDGNGIVGFEALTRVGPSSPWSTTPDLLMAAESHDVLVDFDWRCRLTALRGALDAGLPDGVMLFVNAEPVALETPPPRRSSTVLAQARGLSIVIEITERNLLRDPARLLRAVEHARHLGWRVAVDDVGADSSSLALLPFLRPDVIKLDMGLVQSRPTAHTAAVVSAVAAEADRTGARIVAEGIETEEHLRTALDMGAGWGQGYLFGPPAPLPAFGSGAPRVVPEAHDVAVTVRAPAAVTPYGVVSAATRPRRADEALIGALGSGLLLSAMTAGPSTIVLVTTGSSLSLSRVHAAAVNDVAVHSALTVVFGTRDPESVRPDTSDAHHRYREVAVGPNEPLAEEHSIVVVSPVLTVALVALRIGVGPGGTTKYDYRLTHARDVVLDAATTLLQRIGS
ncbi:MULTISPECIES: EAL domain-containing protein [Nocardiaceae]|uniref:EAL domain-containing protein n=1 Tax=Nocardiaceae TaxID=85025 RepID=UPI001E5C65D2|nr:MULTISPECIES: EAL domain-containing protein [Rhodococcus]